MMKCFFFYIMVRLGISSYTLQDRFLYIGLEKTPITALRKQILAEYVKVLKSRTENLRDAFNNGSIYEIVNLKNRDYALNELSTFLEKLFESDFMFFSRLNIDFEDNLNSFLKEILLNNDTNNKSDKDIIEAILNKIEDYVNLEYRDNDLTVSNQEEIDILISTLATKNKHPYCVKTFDFLSTITCSCIDDLYKDEYTKEIAIIVKSRFVSKEIGIDMLSHNDISSTIMNWIQAELDAFENNKVVVVLDINLDIFLIQSILQYIANENPEVFISNLSDMLIFFNINIQDFHKHKGNIIFDNNLSAMFKNNNNLELYCPKYSLLYHRKYEGYILKKVFEKYKNISYFRRFKNWVKKIYYGY